jgi:hypothetical protein
MISRYCKIADLPDDLQIFVHDVLEAADSPPPLERVKDHTFAVVQIPVAKFPRVKMWTDYRGRGYAEAMVGEEVPPVIICGDVWLDGRNRVWAARHGSKKFVRCIDLSELGLRLRCTGLGKLGRNPHDRNSLPRGVDARPQRTV